MRIFNVNRRMSFDGQEQFDSLNCNLDKNDVKTIVLSLEKFKTDDVVMASAKTTLLSNLKNYCND